MSVVKKLKSFWNKYREFIWHITLVLIDIFFIFHFSNICLNDYKVLFDQMIGHTEIPDWFGFGFCSAFVVVFWFCLIVNGIDFCLYCFNLVKSSAPADDNK